jgi:hypothetical protein
MVQLLLSELLSSCSWHLRDVVQNAKTVWNSSYMSHIRDLSSGAGVTLSRKGFGTFKGIDRFFEQLEE